MSMSNRDQTWLVKLEMRTKTILTFGERNFLYCDYEYPSLEMASQYMIIRWASNEKSLRMLAIVQFEPKLLLVVSACL